jgi:hypothetical protein
VQLSPPIQSHAFDKIADDEDTIPESADFSHFGDVRMRQVHGRACFAVDMA